MRGFGSRQGLTIVELIIAGFILTVILGIVGTYLAKQSQLNRVTMSASEVQDKTRLVMQMVTQDLQLGGARMYVDTTGEIVSGTDATIPSCPDDGSGATCLEAVDNGARDNFSTLYINTLRTPADSCREVGYWFVDTILYRADRVCGTTKELLDPLVDSADYAALADNVLALDIQYKCSDGDLMADYPDGSVCPLRAGYLRSALVTVVGRANHPTEGTAQKTLTVDWDPSVTTDDLTIVCPQDYRCFMTQQEVLMPNFKDR